MQKVVYISNSRDLAEETDVNENKYLARINKLLEDGWTVAQMNTQTVDVDPRLDGCLHKETLVSFVILEKTNKAHTRQGRSRRACPGLFAHSGLSTRPFLPPAGRRRRSGGGRRPSGRR